jgi:serine/threonine-protein kinase
MANDIIGITINGYQLLDRIGEGGMATVYRARDPKQERDVAVKFLPMHLADKETLRKRFMFEAKTMSKLSHPNILPVYDFGQYEGAFFIVLKLADSTLDKLIELGPMPLPAVVRVLHQISSALDYAHGQGLIHRDLKPENIFIDKAGSAYLGDFGIARLLHDDFHLTTTGAFTGTAAYASPEQCRSETLTPATDVYSLGVVAYEMFTGKRPFEGKAALALMHKHMTEPVPDPRLLRPDLPPEIVYAINRAMAKRADARYSTAGAFSAAVAESLRRTLGTKPLTAATQQPVQVFSKKDNYLWLYIGIVIVWALIMLVIALLLM